MFHESGNRVLNPVRLIGLVDTKVELQVHDCPISEPQRRSHSNEVKSNSNNISVGAGGVWMFEVEINWCFTLDFQHQHAYTLMPLYVLAQL